MSRRNDERLEEIARVAIDQGFKLHSQLGPGLFESVYEALLTESLKRFGFHVERQKLIPIRWNDISLDEGFRADLIVEGCLLIELKSVETLAKVHGKQVLTYLRLLDLRLGLLMNFGAETFKEGLRRISNDYYGNWSQSENSANDTFRLPAFV
ncbi:MAG: GxxExxY protein [Novosphingobium sp.]